MWERGTMTRSCVPLFWHSSDPRLIFMSSKSTHLFLRVFKPSGVFFCLFFFLSRLSNTCSTRSPINASKALSSARSFREESSVLGLNTTGAPRVSVHTGTYLPRILLLRLWSPAPSALAQQHNNQYECATSVLI